MAQNLTGIVYTSRKADGTPNALGKIYAYAAGTLTPQATYTTQAGTTANANPVVLGADGTAPIWYDPDLSYRIIEKTAADVTIRDVDNLRGYLTSADLATSASFAGIGDGSTDDTAVLQAALTANAGGMVLCAPDKNYSISSITIPDDTILDLRGSTLTERESRTISQPMIAVGNRCTIINGTIDAANGNTASTVDSDGAYYSILFKDKTGLRVRNVRFLRHRYAVVMATTTGTETSDMEVSGCTFISTIWPLATPDSLPYGVFVGNTTNATNTTIGTFDSNWTEALLVHGARIFGNRIVGGQYGVALQRCSGVTVSGNTVENASRGISVQHQCRDITISGNNVKDCHAAGIHLAYGVRDAAVIGNTVTGTMSNDKTALQAYYGCQDIVIANNVCDTQFDQWAGGESLEQATPAGGFGIRVGQTVRNIKIDGNQLRGFGTGIAVLSTIYPAVISSGDANYHKCGAVNVSVTNNTVIHDYSLGTATTYRAVHLAANTYGIIVGKTGAWEDSTQGALGIDDVSVVGNRVYDTFYALVWQYVADSSGNPAAKTRLVARRNRSVSSIGTGADVYSGDITGASVDSLDNSWADSGFARYTSYTPTATSLTLGAPSTVTLAGKYWRYGDRIRFHISIVPSGGTTTASTLGTTRLTVGGLTPADYSVAQVVNRTTGASLGTCPIDTNSSPVVLPSWSATTNSFDIVGEFRV